MRDGTVVRVRPMTEADASAVLEIYRQGIEARVATFEAAVPEWRAWHAAHRRECRLVAEIGDAVVGWTALARYSSRAVYAGVAWESVYVDASARGRGVGTALLEAVIPGCRIRRDLDADRGSAGQQRAEPGAPRTCRVPARRVPRATRPRPGGYVARRRDPRAAKPDGRDRQLTRAAARDSLPATNRGARLNVFAPTRPASSRHTCRPAPLGAGLNVLPSAGSILGEAARGDARHRGSRCDTGWWSGRCAATRRHSRPWRPTASTAATARVPDPPRSASRPGRNPTGAPRRLARSPDHPRRRADSRRGFIGSSSTPATSRLAASAAGSARVRVIPNDTSLEPDIARSVATRDELDHAFRRLTPEQRAVVVLHHHLGYPLTEIAATLGIPAGTARSRLHHAVRQLRIALDDDGRSVATSEERPA